MQTKLLTGSIPTVKKQNYNYRRRPNKTTQQQQPINCSQDENTTKDQMANDQPSKALKQKQASQPTGSEPICIMQLLQKASVSNGAEKQATVTERNKKQRVDRRNQNSTKSLPIAIAEPTTAVLTRAATNPTSMNRRKASTNSLNSQEQQLTQQQLSSGRRQKQQQTTTCNQSNRKKRQNASGSNLRLQQQQQLHISMSPPAKSFATPQRRRSNTIQGLTSLASDRRHIMPHHQTPPNNHHHIHQYYTPPPPLIQPPPLRRTPVNNSAHRSSPTSANGVPYAGAKFSESPSANQLPPPPINWLLDTMVANEKLKGDEMKKEAVESEPKRRSMSVAVM